MSLDVQYNTVTALGADERGLLVGRADGLINRETGLAGTWRLPAAVVAIASAGELRFAATAQGEVFSLGKGASVSSLGVLPGAPRRLAAHPDGFVQALVGTVLYTLVPGRTPVEVARGLSGFAWCDHASAQRSLSPDNPVDPWSFRADLTEDGRFFPPGGAEARALPGAPTHIALAASAHVIGYCGTRRLGIAPAMNIGGTGNFDVTTASPEAVVFLAFVGGTTLAVVHADGRGLFLSEHDANLRGRINVGFGVLGGCYSGATRELVLWLADGSYIRVPVPPGEGVTFLAPYGDGVVSGDFRGVLAGFAGVAEAESGTSSVPPATPTWTHKTGQDWRAVYATAGAGSAVVAAGGPSGEVELVMGSPPARRIGCGVAGPVEALVFSPDGRTCFVGSGRRGSAAVDLASRQLVWESQDDLGFVAVAATPELRCFALSVRRGSVLRLDPATGAVTPERERGAWIGAWACSGELLCLDHGAELEVIDVCTLVTTATIPVDRVCSSPNPPLNLGGRAPHWALVTPEGHPTLLVCRSGGEIRVYAAASGALRGARPVPTPVRCVVVDTVGAQVHVGFEDASFGSFTLGDLAPIRVGDLPATPTHLAVDRSGGLWAGGVNSEVWRIGQTRPSPAPVPEPGA